MSTGIIIFAGLLLTLGVLWYKNQSPSTSDANKKNTAVRKPSANKSLNQYRSVGIQLGLDCCEAVKSYRNKKILLNEAPVLPVKGCNKNGTCECRFVRYSDRRTDDRRESSNSARQRIMGDQLISKDKDARTKRDRRNPKA